jgi:Zn-dependent protease with chaperone function
MKGRVAKPFCFLLAVCLYLFCAVRARAQQSPILDVPSGFNLDVDTAARLRPQLMAQSVDPSEQYGTGTLVFDHLVEQVLAPSRAKFAWQLRIVASDDLNACSSPDGSVYVEAGLAQLAGGDAGMWAAILSHEIAHIVRRDWARRYLYQKYLENGGGNTLVLGIPVCPRPPGLDRRKPPQTWADSAVKWNWKPTAKVLC